MNTFDKPIPPGEPLPHRKIIREWLIPLAERTTVYAIGLMLMEIGRASCRERVFGYV